MIKFKDEGLNGQWVLINDEEQFLMYYPEHVRGTYRPQPYYTPEKYPCLCLEIATMNNNNGHDHVMIAYIYDFEMTED